MDIVLSGVGAVAGKLSEERGGGSAQAFREVYGIDSSHLFEFEWNSECYNCRADDTIARCGGTFSGDCAASGAYTHGPRHIEFATMSAWNYPLRQRNQVVHELGHAFNWAMGNAPYVAMDTGLSDNPDLQRGTDPNAYYGFASRAANPDWQQNWDSTGNEIFADQFLAWTFDMWYRGSDPIELARADARSAWMSARMDEWLTK